MMKSKLKKCKPAPLLPALLVSLGVMMSAAVTAGETFLSMPDLTDLQDGDITLARAERGRAGLHMSVVTPSGLNGNSQPGYALTSDTLLKPDVYLSLRLPW